ncbi:HAD-IA family hydrolase [Brevundimonas sp. BH3]|uniref:HAD family hydrolase n=1 Tax=Brevundimonas sp. BH3 TaxID=3133089 RepID=UPI003245B82F
MKILFFLEPSLELNDPYFRYPTLRNVIKLQAHALVEQGHDVHVLAAEHLLLQAAKDGHEIPGPIGISSHSYTAACINIGQIPASRLKEPLQPELAAIIKTALPEGYEPDHVIIWESPAEYLKKVFPSAAVKYQMPGVFSRPPFGDSVTYTDKLLEPIPSEYCNGELFQVENLRKCVGEFYDDYNPFSKDIRNIRSSYDHIVLVPLQVDGYFMVDALENNFSTQFDFLVYVLENTPSDIAVIATQYKGRNGLGSVLNDGHIRYLKESYKNFVYLTKSDAVPYCSQYLAPHVDGIVGLSSSIIAHGALWQKPVLAFGRSHVSEFATADTFNKFVDQVRLHQAIDRDAEILSFVNASQISVSDILANPTRALGLDATVDSNINTCFEHLDFEAALASQPDTQRASYTKAIVDAARGCSVVSFDIFDTLLVRTYAKPVDVFEVVGARYADSLGLTAQLFTTYRRDAERRAFQQAVSAGRGEIHLQQIYDELARIIGVNPHDLDAVAQYEIEVELQCLTRREPVCAAFDKLKTQGKRIVLVSDMYLPSEVLRAALEQNGIEGYEKLYLSCDIGLKKHSGKLFEYVLSDLQIAADRVLHVGDNEHGDIKMAAAQGINTIHVMRPWDTFEKSALYENVWSSTSVRHELDLRRVLAVMAKDEYADAHVPTSWFDGDASKLGYFGLGPLLFDYTNWLIQMSVKNGTKKLFFLARDGKIMKEAYDLLAMNVPNAPKSEYLLCSRRAVNVANLTDGKALERLLELEYTTGTLAAYIEGRFGIPAHRIPKDILEKHGLELNTVVGTSSGIDAKPLVRDISPMILQNASEERALYLEYLRDVGFSGADISVVDIGYAGTMQESLLDLAGLEHLAGYYVVTFRPALDRMRRAPLSFYGYLGNFVDRHDTTQLWARHVPLYETMFSTEETSFMRFMVMEGRRVPVYMNAGRGDALRVDVVKNIRRGALRFIRSMTAAFGDEASTINIGPEKALKTLASYFAGPSKEDAKILQGVAFEDAYGGGRGTVILAQDRVPGEVWRAGRAALTGEDDRRGGRHSAVVNAAEPISGGVMFNANHLQTNIGLRERTSYRVPEGASDGMLCFGPYRRFERGKWTAVYVIHTDRSADVSLNIEVVMGQSDILSRQKLTSRTIEGVHSFSVDFDVPSTDRDIEFRVWVKDAASVAGLKVLSVSAYPSFEVVQKVPRKKFSLMGTKVGRA